MNLVCLDLEGVLVPEIWINFAEKTGLDELKKTTRDEPDYNVLMKGRIDILAREGFTLKDIQNVIDTMDPLEGALEFLDEVRSFTQIIILSDTFEEFAAPLMKKLKYPTLFCNSLIVDGKGMIRDFKLRKENGKKFSVEGFKHAGCRVFAAGDSYNDLAMIQSADGGALFRAPDRILDDFPHLKNHKTYEGLMSSIREFHK
ncbi:bifunctional phosphoserine phosphatase/homoserine phosphotransferase ThrH [Spirochaeta isovalerica]|uniref:Phosphoserine/homoserine phosphotransferase n=1 Tax=Spirochaeta isovalerica TaxID=150 RepID=A0A841RGZ6_9SPIO|nr:bifunctional phosphoserine phosphatase/homoserine phosphotransferase ThrH [Spirochaeta isovalerica]MBB6482059.1 phosphoserine/homoserine phosphotransferase [Spirochaeta isovalerica]